MGKALDFLLPWDSQPQEAVEHSHAYGKADLSFERGGLRSSVSGATLTLVSTPSQEPTLYGIARVFSSSTQYLNSADWPVLPDGTEYTYLVVFHRTSTSGAIEFLVNGDNASRSFQYRLEASGAVTLIAFNTAVSTFSVTGSVVPVGEMHCALAVVRQSGVQLFQNGRHTGTSSAITGTIKGQTASEIQLGNRLGSYLSGSIGQVVRWPFALDSGAARELSANPWQLFAPRSIWVPVSAGGGADGNASTTPAASTLTAPTATGSGSAQASTAPAGSTLTAPTATASASAQASGALAGVSLTAPTATATGTTAGNATGTGAPAGLTLTAPTATASGSAQASGAPAGSALTAPTGTASSAGHAIASGAPADLTMTAPTATATGSAQAFAAFITAVLTAPTGTASNGEAPESGHSSTGYGGGGGSGHVGARERLRSRKALADLFEDIKLVKPKEKAPELTEHQEQTIQHALEVVREAQEAVRQTLEKLAEASPLPAQLKTLQAKLRQLEADLEEEEAAVVSLLLL